MIVLSIDVKKIPPGRTIPGKNGAAYLDLILIENKDGPDRFGQDGFCKIGATKKEREDRVQLPIVGNWKRVGESAGRAAAPDARRDAEPIDDDEQIPF